MISTLEEILYEKKSQERQIENTQKDNMVINPEPT